MKFIIKSQHAECLEDGVMVAPGTEVDYDPQDPTPQLKMLEEEGILVSAEEEAQGEPQQEETTTEEEEDTPDVPLEEDS